MKIIGDAKNLDGKGCLVREASAEFPPKTGEGAVPKAQLNPRATLSKKADAIPQTWQAIDKVDSLAEGDRNVGDKAKEDRRKEL